MDKTLLCSEHSTQPPPPPPIIFPIEPMYPHHLLAHMYTPALLFFHPPSLLKIQDMYPSTAANIQCISTDAKRRQPKKHYKKRLEKYLWIAHV